MDNIHEDEIEGKGDDKEFKVTEKNVMCLVGQIVSVGGHRQHMVKCFMFACKESKRRIIYQSVY